MKAWCGVVTFDGGENVVNASKNFVTNGCEWSWRICRGASGGCEGFGKEAKGDANENEL